MAISEKSQVIIENIVVIGILIVINNLLTSLISFKYIIGVLWSIPIVMLIKRYNLFNGALVILISSIITLLKGINADYVIFLIQFAPLALIIGYNLKKQFSFGKGMLLIFAVSLMINSSLVFLTLSETKAELVDIQDKIQIDVNSTITSLDQQGFLKKYQKFGIDRKMVEDTLLYENVLMRQMVFLLPGILTINYILSLFIIYLTGYRFFGKKHSSLGFASWHVPWYFIWLVIIGIGTILTGDYYQINLFLVSGLNFLLVITPLFLTLGLSVTIYYLKRWKPAALGKVLIFILVITSPQLVFLLILFLGIFDPYFDFRGLTRGKDSVSGG